MTKSASSSFTRTFAWDVQKSVDQLRQTVAPGASATFNYLVDVSKGAGVDSGWVVSGAITVSNANDWVLLLIWLTAPRVGVVCSRRRA